MALLGSVVGLGGRGWPAADRDHKHASRGAAIGNADPDARQDLSVSLHGAPEAEPLLSAGHRRPRQRADRTRSAKGDADRVADREHQGDDCLPPTAAGGPGACGPATLPSNGRNRPAPALSPPDVSVDEVLDTLREFDRFGGASLGLIAWEFSVEPPRVVGAWKEALAAGLIRAADFDHAHHEQLWRLSVGGWSRVLAAPRTSAIRLVGPR